jgi:molybdopterin-guanine dinucleotide biosynthesis protein A
MHNSHNANTAKPITNVTGVLLAGGKSRRMGRDKASLVLNGQALYSRSLELLCGYFQKIMISGDRPDLVSEKIPGIPDIYPGSALGGIFTSLHAAETDWIFVSPCDMPYPDSQILEMLLEKRNGVDAVVPETPEGYEPVFALYHKNCLPIFEKALQQGRKRIISLYPELNVHFLNWRDMPGGWETSLMNINTPEDIAKIKEERQ